MKNTSTKQYFEIVNEGPALESPDAGKLPWYFSIIRICFRLVSPIFPKFSMKIAYRLFTTPFGRAKHQVSDELLESVQVSEFAYGKNLLKLYQWGNSDKTILLIHGWSSRGTALRSFVPLLLNAGYQVVAVDGPAHGDSPGHRLNLPVYEGMITALFNRFERVEAIIGHSFGGGTCLHMLYKNRHKIYLPKLIIIGSPIDLTWVVENSLNQFGLGKKAKMLFIELVREKIGLPFELGNANLYFSELPLGKLLIIHDKQDYSVPFEQVKSFYDRQKGVTLIATEGMGHFKLVKHPKVIQAVTDFIVLKDYQTAEACPH